MKTTPDMAAFVNGLTSHYADMADSYHFPNTSHGHPSHTLTPVLAAAEHVQANGRDFITAVAHGRPALLLSHGYWRQQLGSDPSIIGQSVTLGKQQVTVVGVLPDTFDFGSVFAPGQKFDLFVPLVMDEVRNEMS